MVQAAAGALLPVLSVLGNQTSRRSPGSSRIQPDSVLPAIAAAPDKKRAKILVEQAREERLMALLQQPEVLAFILTFAGVGAAQVIPFSQNKAANEAIQAVLTSTSVLMGLGLAGVGDLTTLLVAALAGTASLTDLFTDIGEGLTSGGINASTDWMKGLFGGTVGSLGEWLGSL